MSETMISDLPQILTNFNKKDLADSKNLLIFGALKQNKKYGRRKRNIWR